jgi:uncharacterized DUF497 family protein
MTTGIPYIPRWRDVFEWDEAKRAKNIAKHGIDFVAASRVFDDAYRIELFDRRRDILFVAYTVRNGAIRIISARRASKDERDAYYANRAAR